MLSVLFWNMGRKQAANALAAQACASRRIGLLIVAECSDLTDLGQRLAGLATPLVRIGRAPSNVTIFSAFARPDARQVPEHRWARRIPIMRRSRSLCARSLTP
jgi:hypothetical protein